jgi:hypothetical protein
MGRSKNWKSWDQHDVGGWLKNNALKEWAQAFVENKDHRRRFTTGYLGRGCFGWYLCDDCDGPHICFFFFQFAVKSVCS